MDIPDTTTQTLAAKRSAQERFADRTRRAGKRRLLWLALTLAALLCVYCVVKRQRRFTISAQEREIIARSEAAQRSQQEVEQLQDRIRQSPNDPRWRQELARHYLQVRLWMDAAEVLEDAVHANDNSSFALNTLGEAYWQLHNREQAIRWFKQNIRAHPQEFPAYLRLSAAYVELGEAPWALDVLRHIPPAAIQPSALTALAHAYARAGDYARADALCAKRLQSEPNDAEAWWISAQNRMRAGRLKEAEAALTQTIRLYPNRAEPLYALAACRARLAPGKEMVNSVPLWTQAVQLDPHMGLAYYDLATVYERDGQLQAAISAYVRAYDAPPHPVQALADLARVYARAGNLSLAHKAMALYAKHKGDHQGEIREFEARLKLEPNNDLAAVDLADAYQGAGRLQDAIRVLNQALKQDGQSPGIYYRLAHVYEACQRVTDEKDCLQHAVQGAPVQAAAAYRELCRIAMEQEGDYDRAETYIARAIGLNPNDPDYRDTQGLALALRASTGGRLQKAMDAFNDALVLNPFDLTAIYQQGLLLQKDGKLDEAAAHFRAAISLVPTYGEAYLKLYQVYRKQGKTERAAALMSLYNDYRRASADRDMLGRNAKAHPNDPAAAAALALFLLRNGELEPAEKQYQHLATLQPTSPVPHERLAEIYNMEGRTPDELEELHLAAQRSAGQTALH
jgi:tetratricopeptide (TPR) repeat protein